MNKPRIINAFLDQGLLALNGNDVWFDNIVKAAAELANYLRANPEELLTFLASALKKDAGSDDASLQKVQEILESVWMTYRSASMGDANVIFRGIIFDAVVSMANSDENAKLTVALYLDAVLTHVASGKEEAVLQDYLTNIQEEVSTLAEAAWTIPTEIVLPAFPATQKKSISLTTAKVEVDEHALLSGIEAALGPHDVDSQPTNGNRYWPNNGHNWAKEFTPGFIETLKTAFNEVGVGRKASLQASSIVDLVQDSVERYVTDVTKRLVASTKGVDLRSRLLWWKEAGVSPSARVRYSELEHFEAAGLMAKDYEAMLPPLAPYSVTAFLQACVHKVTENIKPKKLNEIVKNTSTNLNLEDQIADTPIKGSKVFTPVEFAELVFLLGQSLKAAAAIEPQEIVVAETTEDDE